MIGHGVIGWLMLIIGISCRPDLPMNSSITVQGDGAEVLVNQMLYGLSLEEINHGIDGGLYAELIQNRSFEDGMPPLNCPYDAARNLLITPNGWTIPFLRSDSLPGWSRLNPAVTQLYPDTRELINDRNRRSLLVAVSASLEKGRGGIVAEGYRGIPLRQGQRYRFSFFAKGGSFVPKTVRIGLEDASATEALSEIYEVAPISEWRRYTHTFTATKDVSDAVLTISSDTTHLFWIDMVSLFPEDTWKGRENGLRPDLVALIDSLAPCFIRFPGGSFVEGYTAGTFPTWRETVGDVATRKSFWNVWAYGTTNGMGYHEYLQLCEDLAAEPIYVINSGVTSQSRRPRYEDITAMDKLVDEALAAIAYANAPADSAMGALRAEHGHVAPFGLKYVEIGSENQGMEYKRRFVLFQKAIKEAYPEVTVISSAPVNDRPNRLEWVDSHYYAGEHYFLANVRRFDSQYYSRRQSPAFVGEFGLSEKEIAGSMQAALAEACFLIGAENNPERVRRLAYSPLLGNAGFENTRQPLISFYRDSVMLTPSYHVWKLFATHRGDKWLRSQVETYQRSGVRQGRSGFYLFDNSFEFAEVQVNGQPVSQLDVLSGGWQLPVVGQPVADANRWNHLLVGDSTAFQAVFSLKLRRVKGSGSVQVRLCDNGRTGEEADYICLTLGGGQSEFYHQSGSVKEALADPFSLSFESNRWYAVRLEYDANRIACYVDDQLLREVEWPTIPALACVATVDVEQNLLLLKVVNTTQHEERTALHFDGLSVSDTGEAIQIMGEPDARNRFSSPHSVMPRRFSISFPMGTSPYYAFPPNSVTLLLLPLVQ